MEDATSYVVLIFSKEVDISFFVSLSLCKSVFPNTLRRKVKIFKGMHFNSDAAKILNFSFHLFSYCYK